MKLMTKELEKEFAKMGNQSQSENPVVVAKYFNPTGSATWWITEYTPKYKLLYGFVTGMDYNEWGSVSLTELEGVKVGFGLGIERDLHFTPTPIKQALKDYYGKEIL